MQDEESSYSDILEALSGVCLTYYYNNYDDCY
jgi:hypothetical protein